MLQNTPKLSSRSRQIALKRGSKDAAAQSGESQHSKRCACCRRNADATDDSFSASLKVSSSSYRVDATQASAIYEKQLRWKREKDAKDSQLKEFYDSLTRSECTFKNPFYKDAWNPLVSGRADNDDEVGDCNVNTAFFERAMLWANQKEKRMAHEKKIRDDIQLGECTFKPQLSPRKKRGSLSPQARRSWSPRKGDMMAGEGGGVESYAQSPVSKSYNESFQLKSPTQQHQLRLTRFTFPRDVYDALDLEALAEMSESAS